MKKKKTGNLFINIFLLIIFGALLFLMYSGLISMEDIYKNRYPLGYKEIVEKYAKENDIDKYLIYSVIRAESKFDPNAVSIKEAMGLMQIMPETGAWIAEKLKIENFSKEDLFDPQKNIMMGVWYFKYLLDKFDGETRVAIAAYNAGPANAQKWLEREDLSEDGKTLYDIPFSETKKYEKRIMNNYTMYKKLYEESGK